MTQKSAYSAAGVDIDAGNKAVTLMSEAVRSTYGSEVLLGIGAYGGLFDASRIKDMDAPVLVGSTDGVGTKTMVATAMGSYRTIGEDIVNHCIDDILVQGAEPLFFLDYIASPKLDPADIAAVVGGVAKACREAGCAILGGETAEMPGVYQPGELDLAGTIVGVVDRAAIIDGSSIVPGDVMIGLPSSGPHTNGYSLIRSIFPRDDYDKYADVLGCTLGQALVAPHRSYLPCYRAMRQVAEIKGMAHITGGGYVENIPRILPEACGVVVDRASWQVPPLFQLIEQKGGVDHDEMYRVFNMGMALIVFVSADHADAALAAAGEGAVIMGQVTERGAGQRVVLS